MKIIKQSVGLKMAVRALKPFEFFEWNGKICMKLRNRGKSLVDIWDIYGNKPDWLMPGTIIQTVSATYMEEDIREGKPFKNVPWGEMFCKDNVRYFKAYPLQKDKEGPGELNACCMGKDFWCSDRQFDEGRIIHVDDNEPVIQIRSQYNIIRAAD